MPDSALVSPLESVHGYRPALAPAGLFVTGEDRLRLTSFNSAAGVTLTIEGRVYLAGHGLRPFRERHVPNTDRTTANTVFQVGEGWIVDVHVRADAGTPRRGQCFVVLELVRGAVNGAVQPLATLLQGYVTDTQRRGWPGSPLELSTEGPGVLLSVTGADPAAGVEISETIPANARRELLAVRFVLVADATAISRSVTLAIDDGANIFYSGASHDAQTASQTLTYSAGAGITAARVPAALHVEIPLPNRVRLSAGFRFRTVTGNLQAGDNFGAPQYLVEEWIED